jgi:hypothetical protein
MWTNYLFANIAKNKLGEMSIQAEKFNLHSRPEKVFNLYFRDPNIPRLTAGRTKERETDTKDQYKMGKQPG